MEKTWVRLIGIFFSLGTSAGVLIGDARSPFDLSKVINSGVQITGPEEVIFDWTTQKCSQDDIPDIPARAFRDAQGTVQLIDSHYINRRFIGPSLNNLTHDCTIIFNAHLQSDPAKYDDHEWLHSLYTLDGNTIYALIHNEYHGYLYDPNCTTGYNGCWHNSVTLATSTNGGNSYTHATPPNHLVASIPYQYTANTGPVGVFNPGNIIYRQSDGYYYALLHLEQYQAQPVGTCVMRTNNLADPTSWRAWNGTSYSVQFINPYVQTNQPPQNHVCQPVSFAQIQKMHESLTLNTFFNRYLLVGQAGFYDPNQNKIVWGIYYALSDDLISWTQAKLLMEAEAVWTYQCGDPNPIAYPVLLDPNSPSRNFETTGQSVYLYYTRFNYQNCQMNLDRDLIRIPIQFNASDIPPNAPTNLAAMGFASNQINLTWQDNATYEEGFTIERKRLNGIYEQIATVGPNVTSYSNTGLTPNTTFCYRVASYNIAGNSPYSNESCATTLISGTLAGFRVERQTGLVLADGAFYCGLSGSSQPVAPCFNASIGADIAERIAVSESVEPGDVVEMDPHRPKHYRKARGTTLASGIIASTPGIALGNRPVELFIDTRPLLALLGRVYVKATTENGAILPGDLLTVSRRPGYAARCQVIKHCEGAVIGKALEVLDSTEGLILILITAH